MGRLIHVEREKEGIAWIQLNDPDNHNALSEPMVRELTDTLDAESLRESCKVVILTGLPEMFCSGADLSMLEKISQRTVKPVEIILARHLLTAPVPVITAAEGSAVGGGFALALAADIVILAKESRYGMNFMTHGFTPGMGSTRLLEYCLSMAVAHELLYTGELRKGARYENCGGINAILPREKVRAHALDTALRITAHPRESIILLKHALSLPRRRLFEESLTLESLMHEISFAHFDAGRKPDAKGTA